MKIVKIVSFICVLALALTLVSSFAFAAAPEAEVEVAEAGENARSPYRCYVTTPTYLYRGTSTGSGYAYETRLQVGQDLLILSSGHTTYWKHVSMPSGSPTGYVQRAHIIEPG